MYVCVCVSLQLLELLEGGQFLLSSLFHVPIVNPRHCWDSKGKERERESKENVEKTSKTVLCTQKYAGRHTNNRTLYIIII